VKKLVCEDCGTVYYSAAAKTLVQMDERCAKCGGKLSLGDGRGKLVANGIAPVPDQDDGEPTE
jgi:PHP family Zn ribbon phosphoesterase